MNKIKKFFGIETEYTFEWADLSTLLTVLNVTLVLLGWYYAPFIGIVNCVINLIVNIKYRTHINLYIMQVALIILNIYFLTL